ncbi:MAG: outer membrane lipoprotein-sorting protein [Candidatus Binatia bacterium]
MTLQRIAAVVSVLIAAALPARAGSVDEIGRAAEEQARVGVPLRAEIRATIDGVEGNRSERIVMLLRKAPQGEGVETFVDLAEAKLRYLVLADGTAFAAEDGEAKEVALDTPIGATSWVLEDLRPFSIERCGVMRNVDESPRQITILCNPVKGQKTTYVLTTYKFDREKAVPERVMYYQERQDNLVKMLRNEELSLVGRKWLPARITMQNFRMRTKDVFEIEWSQANDLPPEPFDPKTFAEAPIARTKSAAAR